MNNERILSYHLTTKMTKEDLANISAAGFTSSITYQSTMSANALDNEFDYIPDVA